MIKTVSFIGAGNVATHLALTLVKKLRIVEVYSANQDNADVLSKKVGADVLTNLKKIKAVDLVIIAVNDNSIEKVIVDLNKDVSVVHTSGSIGIEVLAGFENAGILYPLQTFSKDVELNLSEVPFLIETKTDSFEAVLKDFCASHLSSHVSFANSEQRAQIHLAAVITNNFFTYLLSEAEGILNPAGFDIQLLQPLLIETLRKSFEVGPKAALTGPAKRRDQKVIDNQVKALKSEEMRKVYQLLTELIQKNTNA